MFEDKLPKSLMELVKVFEECYEKVYLVGGSLRDIFLNRSVCDFDLSSNLPPEKIMELFPKTIATGLKHGTVTVLFKGDSFEITTFRKDGIYKDGRRPESVDFNSSLKEDLKKKRFYYQCYGFGFVKYVLDRFIWRPK